MTDMINQALVTDLPGFALLSISGGDRHTFLHGQCINDLNLIENPGAQLSAWCNPKGQVISTFIIINTGSAYLLLFKRDLAEIVRNRLQMFVLRANVQIDDITDRSPPAGLANINDLSGLGLKQPMSPGEVRAVGGATIVSLPDRSGRYLITGATRTIKTKFSEPAASIRTLDGSIWELLDILAGLPWLTLKTREHYLPQMLNLDALQGLSYQKGCYPGQEVIARVHYKGSVKKRLQLLSSDRRFNIGDALFVQQSDNNTGTVINAATHPDGKHYALAVVELDNMNKRISSKENADADITRIALPYAINR